MCELFALSGRFPATVTFSLEEFATHGGGSGPHKDGWGIAFYEGQDARIIREASSAASSPCVDFLRQHEYRSQMVISHLRMATVGAITLANTQPFSRELAGRMHLFAHNGDLSGIDHLPEIADGCYRPIGETDSEQAFCRLMHQLQPLWCAAQPPSLAARYQVVAAFAAQISPLGPANFLYADGEYLFAHGHQRSQPGREGFHPPGLYWLSRSCTTASSQPQISGLRVSYDGDFQQVALVASVPLTDGPWKPMTEGEIAVFRDGERIYP